ncbi:N/A [soil metagenome]
MGTQPVRAQPTAADLVGRLEYACLSTLWRLGSGSVGQVRADLNTRRSSGAELAYTTVMTVLSRLHAKGILDRTKQGRGYTYVPALTESELVAQLSKQAVDDLLARYGNVAVAQFASAVRDLSDQHVALLRDLIADDEDGHGDT